MKKRREQSGQHRVEIYNDFFSDGTPYGNQPGLPPTHPGVTPGTEPNSTRITDRATRAASRLMQFEGLRGRSTRASLVLRYISYILVIVAGSALTQGATEGIKYAEGGGIFMLLSITSISVVGAVATLFYVNLRNEIIARVRHYIFGIILFPGSLLALFLFATASWWGTDTISTTLATALPVIFLVTVVLPAFIFIKEIAGMRTIYRSTLDDEEAVALWTRQDGLQR
jgi:hypothetical protein